MSNISQDTFAGAIHDDAFAAIFGKIADVFAHAPAVESLSRDDETGVETVKVLTRENGQSFVFSRAASKLNGTSTLGVAAENLHLIFPERGDLIAVGSRLSTQAFPTYLANRELREEIVAAVEEFAGLSIQNIELLAQRHLSQK